MQQEFGVPDQSTLTAAAKRPGITLVTGPPSSALWFDSNMLHGSGSNISPYLRSIIFLVFNSVDNRLGSPFRPGAPRPAYLAARGDAAVTEFVSDGLRVS